MSDFILKCVETKLDCKALREVRIYDKHGELKEVVIAGPPKECFFDPYLEHNSGKTLRRGECE